MLITREKYCEQTWIPEATVRRWINKHLVAGVHFFIFDGEILLIDTEMMDRWFTEKDQPGYVHPDIQRPSEYQLIARIIMGDQMLSHQEIVENSTDLDNRPCVYFLIKDGRVVYVGQSISVLARLGVHVGSKDFDRVLLLPCEKHLLDVVESLYIRTLTPELNKGKRSLTAPMSMARLHSTALEFLKEQPCL